LSGCGRDGDGEGRSSLTQRRWRVAGAAQEPPPIRDTVTKALAEFKKTHHDTWAATRAAFSDAQWDTLTDLAVAPSYFV
jgi:proteasome activator subunit 4